MSKVAFLSSFLATFITLDVYLFDGSTTRAARDEAFYLAHAVNAHIDTALRPLFPNR